MDAYGHVNNVVYLTYPEEARVDMLFTHAPTMGAAGLAEGVVVARHEIDYRRPIAFRPEPIRIETWVSELRTSSFRLGYELRGSDPDDDTVYARASSVMVPYDMQAGRPRRLRPEERALLAGFLDAVPAPSATPPP